MERGNLYLVGEGINSVADVATAAAKTQGYFPQAFVANLARRDGLDHHMTLLSVKEIRDLVNQLISGSEDTTEIRNLLDRSNTEVAETNLKQDSKRVLRQRWRERLIRFCSSFLNDRTTRSQDWFVLGLGRERDAGITCFFLVCLYPRAAALRKKLGLPPKDFHITLGFSERDIHDCSKGVQSLLRPQPNFLAIAPLPIVSTPMELVEKAFFAIQTRRYFYGATLLNAAESIISLQKFRGLEMDIVSLHKFQLESGIGITPRERLMILNILELRCRLLGNDRDFEGVIEHASTWIDVLEKAHSRCVALGYKGVALYMNKQYSKAYPCLLKSYEYFQQFKDERESKPGLAVSIEKVLAKCCKSLGREAPLPALIPFPRTAHLFDTGGSAVSSDDWVLSAKSSFFRYLVEGADVIVEEKIDGANLGFSLSPTSDILAQNRSHYVTEADHSQFGPLPLWIENHRQVLRKILSTGASQSIV